MTRYSPRTGLASEYQVGPFDVEHVLIQWGGTLPGDEQWSCSLRCAPHAVLIPPLDYITQGECDSWCHGAIKDAVLALHQRSGTQIDPAAKLTFVKANRIGENGKYKDTGTSEHLFANIAGGATYNAVAAYPNQICLAVTLTTGFSRGPAHKGRFFLPLPHPAEGLTAGQISSSDADAVKASVATFITAIADTPGVDGPTSYTPVVMSRKAGNPTRREITGVSVGRVLDTQRRRRRSLPEAYRDATVSLGAF